ncbi:DNA topoisomerase 3 [Faecalibacterium prausnitzii]|uniref:DNA topoisomerase n=1 Tax=Faecalibacterium prausnitzii TaxID=853 RepID=A0A3E2UH35_9FIRM|nr:DNA topoisomerase 3 [Faecalibacterium prausnitzii]RGB95613.1 type IA DNA topoisomerase [Faecalibacterium prausnitzii]
MAKLIVTEKPSVAISYAKILGVHGRQDGYLEGNGYLVSWCVGHLVELAPPSAYGEQYVKWNIADLPILPEKWQYLVSASTKKQFGILKKLMHRADVNTVVNSCDAGREGELIFRLVYEQAGCKKPVSRLWLSSMEDSAVRAGFANLKPSTEYDALYQAALCRERADWMVGINCSRLFSCLYGRPLAVGRVMTPTLAMTVEREAAIAAFVPKKFYTVALELTSGFVASSRRISEKAAAEKLLAGCREEMVSTIQKITRKEKAENPPPLYDLTTLQRDANRLLGYSAQQTLDYVQSLYEKQLTTYPRTDSCYIADEDEEMLEELAEELEDFLGFVSEDADDDVPRTRRTVNRQKVTDHHAILPTRSMLQADLDALPKGERNILKLIIARTLMAVSKPFRYLETLLTTECAGEEFTVKGKEILEEGWKAVERKVLADILNRKREFTALPQVEESECGILNAELKEGQTSPPKHFTEDTLLHSMETASADSMPEGVERQGIGTPATRAATIEKLVQKGFLERKGDKKTKVLLPTDKGKALITVMPEEIQSADMTADWETKLLRVERGEMEPETFMTEINDMISSLVNTTEAVKGASALMKNKVIGVCPNCGNSVVEREKGYFCENRECRFVLWKDNAFFKRLGKRMDAHVADRLLRDGRVRLKDCKSSKGKTYNATVLLSTEADGRSKFSLEFEGGR